jgi:prepilin-type N-terminal cleavage/methylation domain-containing protein
MNKKGFTLIELMAVVAIIAIIGVLVIPKILKVKNENINRLYKEQEDRLVDKAREYMNDNYISSSLDTFVITKAQLISGGYISEIYDLEKKEISCTAYVEITNYTTIPVIKAYISCDGYTTTGYDQNKI